MIAVVGGGITGLALGRELVRLGVEVQVLEASARAGGVIRSERVEGHLLDWGPQRLRLTPAVEQLVEELGLGGRLVRAPADLPLFVYRGGRLRRVPFSAGAMASTDLLSPLGKLRLLAEPFTGGARAGESVAGYLERKLGREAYLHLVGPLYGGLYGSDPADMAMELSLGRVLGRFDVGRSLLLSLLRRGARIRPPAACTFADGMEALPRAMAADLGDRLSLDARVRSLGRRGAAWVLETDAGPLEAREVVLAVPAPAAARLLEPVAADAARSAAALRYNPLVVVHVEAETGLRGLGFQVSLAEDLPLRGVTFNDSLFGRSRLYTAYLGGARHAALADEADDVLGGLALETFRHTTGADGRTISVARESMPAWDRSWSALEGLALPGGIHLAGNWTERPGVPGRLAQASALARTLAAGRVGSAGAVPAS